jgi:esterase/lipase
MGKFLFFKSINNPFFVQKIIFLLYKLFLINDNTYYFFKANLDGLHKREKLYNTWLIMKNICPSIKLVAKNINQNNIKTYLLLAKHDNIIPKNKLEPFMKMIQNNLNLHIFDAEHHNLFEKISTEYLKS